MQRLKFAFGIIIADSQFFSVCFKQGEAYPFYNFPSLSSAISSCRWMPFGEITLLKSVSGYAARRQSKQDSMDKNTYPRSVGLR
jgi:hypothetical protein